MPCEPEVSSAPTTSLARQGQGRTVLASSSTASGLLQGSHWGAATAPSPARNTPALEHRDTCFLPGPWPAAMAVLFPAQLTLQAAGLFPLSVLPTRTAGRWAATGRAHRCPGCRGLRSRMFPQSCPPRQAPCSSHAAAMTQQRAAESSGKSPAVPSSLPRLTTLSHHQLTGSVFRASNCAPAFWLASASRPAGLAAAAVGPCAAASSCCCGASSCAFFTSEPGPVSVVMAAGHLALRHTRRVRCHPSIRGLRTPAGQPGMPQLHGPVWDLLVSAPLPAYADLLPDTQLPGHTR